MQAANHGGIIQVAGIVDQAEAHMLVDAGVEWLGFPLRPAYHREDISEEETAVIIGSLPSSVRAVLITYLNEAGQIIELCRKLGTRHVQLHGDVPRLELERLREAAPHLFVIKSLIVRGDNEEELSLAVELLAPVVDAFITDTYDPSTTACGATGKTHDWAVSRRLVERSPKPVVLAGGLGVQNVRRAIREVLPAGVDAHTGLEDERGRKVPALVTSFIKEAGEGFAAACRQKP